MALESQATSVAVLQSARGLHVGPTTRRALVALACASLVGAIHVARVGTATARLLAWIAVAVALGTLVLHAAYVQRRSRNARALVRNALLPVDPSLGRAVLRALDLVDRTATEATAGSSTLAELHLQRLFARAPLERVGHRATRVALIWAVGGLATAALALVVVLLEPFQVVEGLDVLVAQHGLAPVNLAWVEDVDITAVPPEYLRQPSTAIVPFAVAALPTGTTIRMRGRPIHPNRKVVLSDGATESPFVDDGKDGIVASFVLKSSMRLSIHARFGDVRIGQAGVLALEAIPDEAPRVTVEGAPRTVRLVDEPRIPIHYQVTDDHGLREVDLVLRAGAREDRRALSHPSNDVRSDRGGYEVVASDPFFRRTYAPVEITVEARDNDVVSGPKWGKSPPIVVLPPELGEAEARRYSALVAARDALTDLAAARVTDELPAAGLPEAHLQKEKALQGEAATVMNDAIRGSFGGLHLSSRTAALLRGQLRRLVNAVQAEAVAKTRKQHEALVVETGSALLAVDSGVLAEGYRSSQAVAKRLAEVADDAASLCAQMVQSNDSAAHVLRIDAAVQVISQAAPHLSALGDLGQDLGEIVASDLRRLDRARKANDFAHAELVLRDLAGRMRRPSPSFMGGGPQHGVEAGSTGKQQDASSADEDVAKEQGEIEELARDHRANMSGVEKTLETALSEAEKSALGAEAKEHARAIREAMQRLPPPQGRGTEPLARAHEDAEAMATALEGGHPRSAVESGTRASRELGELAQNSDNSSTDDGARKNAEGARATVERELAWAQAALKRLRKTQSDRAGASLDQHGKVEGSLADRAMGLAERGRSGDQSMPDDVAGEVAGAERSMRAARKALDQGDGESAIDHQHEAQRLLEMAAQGRGEREDGDRKDGSDLAGKTEVPGADKHHGPEEFRQRVMRGLRDSVDPALKGAVKRYAEGLLK